jgi:hypothetical protein
MRRRPSLRKLRIHNVDELLDLEHAIKKQFDRWDDLYSDTIQKHYGDKLKKTVRLCHKFCAIVSYGLQEEKK